MQLSDHGIRVALASGEISLEPIEDVQVQPASVDLRLGREFKTLVGPRLVDAATRTGVEMDAFGGRVETPLAYETTVADSFRLPPGGFVLGTTLETVGLHGAIAAKFEGKSSLGRLGLMTHVTAGFIDPGFVGEITLEIFNVSPVAIRLSAGMKVGQLVFTRLDSAPGRPYGHPELGSRYQGQRGATGARG